MRLALAALVCCVATPALSAGTLAEQAHDAYAVFAGGLAQKAFLTTGYGYEIFKDVAGKWVRLNGPDEKSGAESYGPDADKACGTAAALTVDAPNPLQLDVTAGPPGEGLTFTYSLVAGSTFAEHVDVTAYLSSIGLGPNNPRATGEQRALSLSFVNGLTQIYRPSPDIMVMTRDRGYPIVMARCPAE
jgi:hypothetical protein